MLKNIRKAKGMTQKDLARKSGCSLRQIIDWEQRGVEHGVVGNVMRVCRVLGCTIDDLLREG